MLSKKEMVILSCLRQNARQTLTTLSRKTNIPISTIYEKLKLYNKGLIKKNVCLIDFGKLGFNTRAQLLIKVNKNDRDSLREYLDSHFNVNSIFKVSNGFDFMVDGVFKHIKDLEEFNENLEERFSVKKNEYYFVIEELKKEAFMGSTTDIDLINS
ncbi:hypothetical protein H8D83_01785 [Candidatus Woesearchaeota archaeon]|nr:hypothetical protein [Candidatus Woesearchaeota archaeon]MBL7050999.1 hypothetical protein [Candidatus Woesearchaeota archaeon]